MVEPPAVAHASMARTNRAMATPSTSYGAPRRNGGRPRTPRTMRRSPSTRRSAPAGTTRSGSESSPRRFRTKVASDRTRPEPNATSATSPARCRHAEADGRGAADPLPGAVVDRVGRRRRRATGRRLDADGHRAPPRRELLASTGAARPDPPDRPHDRRRGDEHDDQRLDHDDDVDRHVGRRLHARCARPGGTEQQRGADDADGVRPADQGQGDGVEPDAAGSSRRRGRSWTGRGCSTVPARPASPPASAMASRYVGADRHARGRRRVRVGPDGPHAEADRRPVQQPPHAHGREQGEDEPAVRR